MVPLDYVLMYNIIDGFFAGDSLHRIYRMAGQNKSRENHHSIDYNSEIDYKIETGNEDRQKDSNMIIPVNTFKAILYSKHGEYRILKALFGTAIGALLGLLIFISLKYSFKHETETACFISLVCSIVLCVGLSFSVKCRCICFLMIPNFFTHKGRVLYLSMITGIIISGPVMNITMNIGNTSRSIQCSIDLLNNLSSQLQDQLYEPFRDIKGTFKDVQEVLKVR